MEKNITSADIQKIVQEVLDGKWGDNETRQQKLTEAGYSYIEIQSLINKKFHCPSVATSLDTIAQEVLDGKWGNGADRKARIQAAGFNYAAVQSVVNLRTSGTTISSDLIEELSHTTISSTAAKIKVGTEITARGIDISTWQGSVNFNQVKQSGIDFVIIREGYGTSADDRFFEYCTGAQSANLPIHGVYHFCYSISVNEVIAEAQACINHVKQARLGKNTIIFFDFEYDTVARAKSRGVTLGKNECIEFSKIFCNYIQQQGYIAGIYSNLDYYNTMYDPALLKQYVYWVAHYNGGGTPMRAGAYHQWTDKGQVPGISTNVDMNNCYIIKQAATPAQQVANVSSGINFDQYYGKISNCGKDENGRYSGGIAGDQTGQEWRIMNWYNQDWQCILRHPNPKVRELLAQLAIEAAQNDHIGYDQSQNRTYWDALRKSGYYPKNIGIDCEADCSNGIVANTKAVGYLLDLPALQQIDVYSTTAMRAAYSNAGFQILTDPQYLIGFDYLVPGDIILNDYQHATTNLGYGKFTSPQTTAALAPDVGIVNAKLLNVRSKPGIFYSLVTKLKQGTKVTILETVNGTDNDLWYHVKINDSLEGYVSAQYIGKA